MIKNGRDVYKDRPTEQDLKIWDLHSKKISHINIAEALGISKTSVNYSLSVKKRLELRARLENKIKENITYGNS